MKSLKTLTATRVAENFTDGGMIGIPPIAGIRSRHTGLVGTIMFGLCAAFFWVTANAAGPDYFNGFETDLSGWDVFGGSFDASRVATGTGGVTSASGSWHAVNSTGVTAAGNWGGYSGVPGCAASACAAGGSFPTGGYYTSVDIYLDVDGGFANNTRFDFSSAINRPDGSHRRDFIFNAGFYNDSDGSPGSGSNRFIVSASNNSQPGSAYAKNPGRDPIAITTTGWYTFQHHFYDAGGGVLAVDMTIKTSSGTLVHSWTLSDPTDIIGSTVGGNRYGWFDFNEFSSLAFDNTWRGALPVPLSKGCEAAESFADNVGGGVLGFPSDRYTPPALPPVSGLGWDVGDGQCNGSFTKTTDTAFPGDSDIGIELGMRAEQRRVGNVPRTLPNDYEVETGFDPGTTNRAWWNFDGSVAYDGNINDLDALTLTIKTDVGPNVPAAPEFDLLALRSIIDDRNSEADRGLPTENPTATYQDLYQISQNPVFGWFANAGDADGTADGFDVNEEGAWRFILTAEKDGRVARATICIHTPGASCFDFFAADSQDCAILGDTLVKIGNGSVVQSGTETNVCSNDDLTIGANVKLGTPATASVNALQAYDSGNSDGQVLFNNGAHVTGDVLANGDVRFGAHNDVDGDAHAGLDLNFQSSGNTVTGECRYVDNLINSGVYGNSCGSESQVLAPPFANAFTLPVCNVTALGTDGDITTAANIDYGLLATGNYGHVRFGNGNKVELNGAYTFKSLSFGYNNQITISGSTTLQVEQQLVFGNGTKQTLSGGTTAEDIIYLVHSGMTVYSQTFGYNTRLYGTICAPDAPITIGNGAEFEGAVYAKSVNLGNNVDFTAAPAPLP